MSAYTTPRTSPKVLATITALVVLAACALWVAVGAGRSAEAADEVASLEDDQPDVDAAAVTETIALGDLPSIESLTLGRDPFDSVRPPLPEETTSASETEELGGQSGQAPEGTESQGTCTTNGEAVCDGTVVVVLEIDDGTAVVQVDGESYLVAEGETFAAGRFQLLRINAGCADLVYRNGDVAEVFTQCAGASASLK